MNQLVDTLQERLELLTTLLDGLSNNFQESRVHAASLFNLILRLLHQLRLPPRAGKEDHELRSKLFGVNGADSQFVAAWIGKLILFNTSLFAQVSCPGLTTQECEFLQMNGKPDTWTPAASEGLNLVETKVLALRFLASGAFIDEERFVPALYAVADPNSRLSDLGNDILKGAMPSISLEDSEIIQKLFEMYLGTASGVDIRPAARAPLQGKILGLLCKSQIATTFVSETLRLLRAGFNMNSTDPLTARHGLEASKLRTQIFSFVNWVARVAAVSDLAAVAPVLVEDLKNYIEAQGWPTVREELRNDSAEMNLRMQGYETIGIFANASSEELLFDEDLRLLRWLFSSLASDGSGKDVSLSIEQALSSILGALSRADIFQIQKPLVDLLIHYALLDVGDHDSSGNSVLRSTRYVAVRFVNRCLPFHDLNARWMDLVALSGGSNERGEILEEGRRGLDPYWYGILNPSQTLKQVSPPAARTSFTEPSRYAFPDFGDLVNFLFSDKEKTSTLGRGYVAAVNFCRTILFHELVSRNSKSPSIDADWERNIDALLQNDEEIRANVAASLSMMYTADSGKRLALERLVDVALTSFTSDGHGYSSRSGSSLLDMCQLGPQAMAELSAARIPELQGRIYSNDYHCRRLACHVFGLLGTIGTSQKITVDKMLQDFLTKARSWKTSIGSTVHEVYGSTLSLAYWLSHASIRRTQDRHSDLCNILFKQIMEILQESRDKDITEAAMLSASQLCLFGVLNADGNDFPDGLDKLRERLTPYVEKGDENAVHALGNLAMQCPEDLDESATLSRILESLYKLHEKRQPELQFAVGSALSCAAVGWNSKSLIGTLAVEDAIPGTASRTSTLEDMIEKVLKDCEQTKPSLRQASAVWLLCLVQFCGHCDDVQRHLQRCQSAFKGFLADKESLTQETAARGLTLVYEKGGPDLKDDLIKDLVGSFTTAKSNLAGTVSEDTQLFEPGALPTGGGSSVTTYKDIVNLASEVGDPSLVYRFMTLASNSAIWSSRAAFGRFGLSRILSDSSTDGYLAQNPKLYSSLYRYRFDPNENVRTAMNDIWTALVQDTKATIDSHFDLILEDLLKSILNKEWRVRQASCAALADLIQSTPLSRYEIRLTRIWELAFKVYDDIKETVRKAAKQLAVVLTGTLIRSLEASEESEKTAQAMLRQVIPFLLGPSGLEAGAKDVQHFALERLLEITKKARPAIMKPYLAKLIGHLLALLSSIEPELINYLHLNAQKYGTTEQEIDDVRLTSVKLSPMMQAIERCLDMLDHESMRELDLSLINAVKTVIGLPSKAGVSRVLVTLATRHKHLFQPHADGHLRVMRRQLLDRNDTISTTAAATCGYLCRIASDAEVMKLLQYSRKLYFDSEDDRHRVISGEILLSIGKYATDRFASFASISLPFAFFGSHDGYSSVKELFKSAWEDNVGGSRAVLLYLHEIIDLSVLHLDSTRWSVKHTAALTIADTIRSAGDEIAVADSELIWPALKAALDGKTWEGKEQVLGALVLFARSSLLSKRSAEVRSQIKVRYVLR